MVPKVLTLWPCLWPLTYIYKTLTSVITFKQFEIGPLYFTCVFLMTIPFNWYQTFDLLTFTVTFDLYLQNLNLSQNFKTVTGRAFIFLMCIACAKTFPMVPKLLTLWPLTVTFDLYLENFNLGHNFWTVWDRALLYFTCVFLMTRPFNLITYFSKYSHLKGGWLENGLSVDITKKCVLEYP